MKRKFDLTQSNRRPSTRGNWAEDYSGSGCTYALEMRKSLLRAAGSSGRLALAVDPTLKGDETTAIVISVVYRGCAIPVAWRILRANQPGAWMDPIVELLQALAPAVPREMTVVVLCDRGLGPKLWKRSWPRANKLSSRVWNEITAIRVLEAFGVSWYALVDPAGSSERGRWRQSKPRPSSMGPGWKTPMPGISRAS